MSEGARREAWAWLFRTQNRNAQNLRIRIMLERDAFQQIGRRWRALGYPFANLVPSLATAIGTSGDRPSALAELLGIVLAEGRRLPTRRIEALHFAEQTPYATRVARGDTHPYRVLPAEVAAAVQPLLFEVVEGGTALRARGAFAAGERVGGKTGTGDNRHKRVAADGSVISSRASSRTATFAFVIDDRFFGVVTTHVLGEQADRHHFTSSLPVQIFKTLAPELEPLLARAGEPRPTPAHALARR